MYPESYYGMIACVAISRYTHAQLKEDGEFVVNIPTSQLLNEVKVCGSVSERNSDKFELTGQTKEVFSVVKAVSISECSAQIECRVDREIDFEERTWFIGEVVAARKSLLHQGRNALLCDRFDYLLPGDIVGPR